MEFTIKYTPYQYMVYTKQLQIMSNTIYLVYITPLYYYMVYTTQLSCIHYITSLYNIVYTTPI